MGNAVDRKKLYQDNRGGALAMVIVIIAFVGILAGVLMFVAFAGYQMRVIDKQGKDNFYTAETVLDEINVGLQNEISESLTKAYGEVMTNYALYRSANARNKAFHTIYFNELQDRLQKDAAHEKYYDVDKLRSWLSDDFAGDRADHNTTNVGKRKGFGTYGAIVESNVDDGSDDDNEYSGGKKYALDVNTDRLILKDLKVTYVNERGFVSIISTDIRITLPSFNFSQASALPDLADCSMIADDTLLLGNRTAGGNITIKGDAYGGQIFLGTPKGDAGGKVYSALDKEQELSLPTLLSTSVSFEKPDDADDVSVSTVVSRNNVEIAEGSSLKMDEVELWGQNLILTSASVDLKGSVNLEDDMTLAGKNSKAVLGGEYNGFGYLAASAGGGTESGGTGGGSGEGEDENPAGDLSADSSSAIVINGRDSILDLSGLERLTINGRAYVSTSYHKTADTSATEDEKKNQYDIMMGESVAVKSNQLIYLVPGEALGCRKDATGAIGDSEFGCNPLTLEQYEEIINNPDQYLLLDGSRQIPALGYKSLNNYIKEETVAGGGSAYVPEIVFKQTNAGPLVYCYLRFLDEDAANRYFRDYYDINTESVDKYTKLYAKEIKMKDADQMLYLNIAGNMLTYEGDETWAVVGSTDSSGNIQQAKRISAMKEDVFKSLRAKLVRTSNQLTDEEKEQTAFKNIIDETELEIILHEKGTSEAKIDTLGGSPESAILTKKDEYIVDGSTPSSVKIIVSLGDVIVKKDFKGLILAKGNIFVEADAPITLEPIDTDAFANILRTKIDELSAGKDYYLLNIFKDGVNYIYNGNTSGDMGTDRVSMVDLISYERWGKK